MAEVWQISFNCFIFSLGPDFFLACYPKHPKSPKYLVRMYLAPSKALKYLLTMCLDVKGYRLQVKNPRRCGKLHPASSSDVHQVNFHGRGTHLISVYTGLYCGSSINSMGSGTLVVNHRILRKGFGGIGVVSLKFPSLVLQSHPPYPLYILGCPRKLAKVIPTIYPRL